MECGIDQLVGWIDKITTTQGTILGNALKIQGTVFGKKREVRRAFCQYDELAEIAGILICYLREAVVDCNCDCECDHKKIAQTNIKEILAQTDNLK